MYERKFVSRKRLRFSLLSHKLHPLDIYNIYDTPRIPTPRDYIYIYITYYIQHITRAIFRRRLCQEAQGDKGPQLYTLYYIILCNMPADVQRMGNRHAVSRRRPGFLSIPAHTGQPGAECLGKQLYYIMAVTSCLLFFSSPAAETVSLQALAASKFIRCRIIFFMVYISMQRICITTRPAAYTFTRPYIQQPPELFSITNARRELAESRSADLSRLLCTLQFNACKS